MRRISTPVFFACLIFSLLGGFPSAVAQSTFTLTWNANPEPDVVGYRVYVGTASRRYSLAFPTQSPSINLFSSLLSGLPLGSTLYFAVTAVNRAGLESSYSEEVSTGPEPPGLRLSQTLHSSPLVLTVTTLPGATVAFESSTDLRNWSFYLNHTANSQGVASHLEPRSSMSPTRFFRVQAP